MRKPLIATTTGVLAAIMLILGGVGAAQVSNQTDLLPAADAQRAANGRAALTWDNSLAALAQSHADTITWADHVGGLPAGTAENVDWAPGGNTSATQVVADWMASPEHRANLLGSNYTRAGGGYNPDGAWVMIYGTPEQAAAPVAPLPPAPVAVATPTQNDNSGAPELTPPPPVPPASYSPPSAPQPGGSSSPFGSAPSSGSSGSSGVLAPVSAADAQAGVSAQGAPNSASSAFVTPGASGSNLSKPNRGGASAFKSGSSSASSQPLTKTEASRLASANSRIEAASTGAGGLILLLLVGGVLLALRNFRPFNDFTWISKRWIV